MQPWSQPLLWKGVATAVATCTYDPATVSAGAALSNGNLTVTHVSGSNQGAHLPDATDSKTTGKLYYEMTYTVLAGTINGGMIGVAVVGTSYTQFGLSTNSVTAYANGNLNTGGSNIYNYGARSVGNVIGVAIDLDNRLAWFKQVSGTPGNWNGNTANGNPVTLLNGITIPAGSIEPYTALGTNASDAFTINLGASAFTGAIPSGYSAWCPAVACDPYFGNVVLLDGFNGANGSTSSIDESPAAHGAATFAGTTTLSTTQAKFGTASLNNTSNITGGVTWPYSTDWALGSGKFTVECWYYANALGSKQALVAQFAGLAVFGWIFMLDNTNKLTWYVSTTGADLFTDLVQSSTFTSGTWHHCAVDFDGTKYRLYYDGVMVASSTTLRNIYNPGYAVSVGNDVALGNNYPMNGYLDEVRITKGVAQYASDAGFAVPTAPFPRS